MYARFTVSQLMLYEIARCDYRIALRFTKCVRQEPLLKGADCGS